MAQFNVHRNISPDSREWAPYLLDVQNDLLDPLATRVVVPLIKTEEMAKPAKRLNPRFIVENTVVLMSTAELAGIPIRALGEKVTSLGERRDEIMAALDMLFTGL
ncbi:MAG: plasmid maintenance protein CcdB [Candidatus Muproteobacteria bacterium RIFCSPHIGHO2_12_FULL_60_33]|uniref:Toxin CcdB n=1 Tax=Candidatus Muproteobacteria bacterium RIFCSPLOWO2_01_FULL_60_18 TaxID=1817768 RepID=A0A1F6TZ35_9PROT|nr:MAG: plasmid maintenance protein CcdB [Candidatus Muproteobacteria bacterium RIFCSPHIGHO2_01_60_12]OGI50383.1 MAG: plasmid maintenance protein CcdB [Candidatus Muproteobacteria bacterium RIFCSPLOWO2_01_FULL_60_18]OGI54183.1 MAG: plasmid maintenance protein CcdB [Candidatus Muproteobacteria bacterium RIFCSPHIGHO2_02_FULL_60_13]OGI54651.1 MAG: plasmid maintenance protein CcdB [Candidatus Muproteobacteria bacterium RIFCSPHIGHO2_12_FULL_60_33]